MEKELLTIAEVCEYLRTSKSSLFWMRKDQRFPKPVLSHKKQLWKKIELDEYLEKTRQP